MACTATKEELLALARCLTCLTMEQLQAIETYLLARWHNKVKSS